MAASWLTQTISGVVPSAGLERPLKVVKITFENPTAGGTITVTDGSTAANVIFEKALATAGATVPPPPDSDFAGGSVMWRNFQVTAFPAGAVMWIYRR